MSQSYSISLDLAHATAERVGSHGLDAAYFENLSHRVRGFRARLNLERGQGRHNYLALPHDQDALETVLRSAAPRMGHFDDLVVLGIGGSSLGLWALYRALSPLGGAGVCVHVVDNTDPLLFADIAGRVSLKRTLFVAVSKSGSTLETVLALGFFAGKLRAAQLKLADHLMVVTDPEKGPLKKFADEHELETLSIPPGVGGRFSVLTAAGLLPAALAGLDIGTLMEGAEQAERACRECALEQDWPARLGLVATDLCRDKGKRGLVFMPYSSRLAAVADWLVQLWDESLGKSRRLDQTAVEAGQTAIRAVGATDQHAQLQLFLEGPNDKFTLFARVERPEPDLPLGDFEWGAFDAEFVRGKTLSQVLNAQQRGTAQALAERQRPSATLSLPTLSPRVLGELLLGLELATTYAGFAWAVDAYDQPAVELGKRISRRILGG